MKAHHLFVHLVCILIQIGSHFCASAALFSPGKFIRLPILHRRHGNAWPGSVLTSSKHTPSSLKHDSTPLLSPDKTRDSTPYHTWTIEACLAQLGVTERGGLSVQDASARLARQGPNTLVAPPTKTFLRTILEQFKDRLVLVLLGVASLSAVLAAFEHDLHAFAEPAIISAILLLNAVIGAMQALSAQDALDALQKLQPSFAVVLRQGEWKEIPVAEVVPGDIVTLRTGDKVPADGRVVSCQSSTIRVDQSSLTGESNTVFKDADTVDVPAAAASCDLTDKTNLVFSGTMVTQGSCTYVVTHTGDHTEMGKVNAGILVAKLTPMKTPLMQSLETFSSQLYKIIAGICLSVWVVNIPKFSGSVFSSWNQGAIHYAKVAVALGVAAIPEGLPAIITLSLALGTSKMAKRNVIVRKLSSVETLGCTSVICTDKTGTLTTNQMTVKKIVTVQEGSNNKKKQAFSVLQRGVEGNSYEPAPNSIANFEWDNNNVEFFQDFATICSLCNNAKLSYDPDTAAFQHLGEPTEAALKVVVEKLGVRARDSLRGDVAHSPTPSPRHSPARLSRQSNDHWKQQFTFLSELEFSRDRKLMSVLYRNRLFQKNRIFTKGAAEVVLSRCNRVKLESGRVVAMTPTLKQQLYQSFEAMANQSYRCLGLALKDASEISSALDSLETPSDVAALDILKSDERFDLLENDMIFIGFCGILDPPRPEIKAAIQKCQEAGVRVMMITGDSKETASSIARDVGILAPASSGLVSQRVFSGKEFFRLPSAKQYDALQQPGNLVFCRAEPQDKQTLIRMLGQGGDVVAMTGDGVNDAPALQQADIGIAMGITGTEVAKGAADMVLVDDNFSSIVSAIEEGRNIYNNMQTFIFFLISSNIGEVFSIFTAAMLGLPDLLTPIHLLWVNLVTDGPPATALGFNPPAPNVMRQAPRLRNATLFPPSLVVRFLVSGGYVAFATIGSFLWWFLDRGVGLRDLSRWEQCREGGSGSGNGIAGNVVCQILSNSLSHPQSMALSALVLMEMFKAISAISLDASLLQFPPWKNPLLVASTVAPLLLHVLVMYTPALSAILRLQPLALREWKVFVAFAVPIMLVEEMLKYFSRRSKNSCKQLNTSKLVT